MSEYYAMIRSTDHLAHYGIKGMKWGVRKAKAKGVATARGQRAMRKQYVKAQKKLAKLNQLADLQVQSANVKKHNKRAAVGLGFGLVGLAGFARNEAVAKKAKEVLLEEAAKRDAAAKALLEAMRAKQNQKPSARQKRIVGEGKGIYKTGEGLGTGAVGTNPSSGAFTRANADPVAVQTTKTSGLSPYEKIKRASAVVGMAGFGTAAYQKGRAIAAKRRTTKEGHARAVAKRNEFKREMDRAFAGTRYATRNQNGKRKRR